mmetsp:Transcript_5728/g.16101  ORF Transcript_5728/g.16101 Transcript_5728/m.16101 type:complete len:308 (+) Transcript_5728:1350-2273(+)
MFDFIFRKWKDGNAQQIRQSTMPKGMKKQRHTTKSQITIPKPIIVRQDLGIGKQIAHALNVRHQPGPLRGVKRKGAKHLGRFPSFFPIDKTAIGIVLDKAGTVIVAAGNEAFDGHPGGAGTLGKFHGVGAQKDNGPRRMSVVEFVRPVHGFVLQQDIVLDGRLGVVGRVDHHLTRSSIRCRVVRHVRLGHVITGPFPSVRMKSMIGRRGRWGGHFFHAKTMSHGPVRKGLRFDFDNGFVLVPRFRRGMVQVSDHAFGGNVGNVILRPNIFFANDLDGGALDELGELVLGRLLSRRCCRHDAPRMMSV